MKQYCIYFLSLFFSFHLNTSAQEIIRCGTPAFENALSKKYPAYKKSIERIEQILQSKKTMGLRVSADEPIYTIPVVVHVLFNSSISNISDDRIFSQIKVLNEDYSRLNPDTTNTPLIFKPLSGNAKIRFVLANRDPNGNVSTGILRRYVSNKSFLVDNSKDDSLLKSISRWPSDRYLNIWVTTLSNNQNNKVLGYTFNPGSYALPDLYSDIEAALDGVVVDYTYFGVINSTSKYNLGRTTTHEVGHWLGLRHIWGDNYCGNDYVDDTPLQENNNLNIDKEQCVHYSTCSGASTRDMSDNFMDYSPDECMNIFTKGQVNRMRTVMETNSRRIKIQASGGYCNVAATAALPVFQGFEMSVNNENFSVVNTGNDNTFIQTPLGQNTNCLSIDNTLSANGSVDYYETIPISFVNAQKPMLQFDLAYAPANAGKTDSLVISYNSNCSAFYPISTLYGPSLTTMPLQGNTNPTPADWKSISINLPAFTNKIAQIRFENYSKSASKLYLDNINIYDATSDLRVVLYPNPVIGEVLIAEIFYKEVAPVQFFMYNIQGKLIKTLSIDTKDFRKKIDASGLASGLYLLKTIVNDKVIIKKFLVESN